jgi:predicted RNA-binding protein with PIN domain
MIIIIDAYNYLKNILHVSFVEEAQINVCIREYIHYAAMRNNQILLVFDAGPYDQITYKNVGKNVVVYYSGSWCSADDVIKDLVLKKRQEDILLVTSDREICAFADMHDIVSIGVLDFHEIWRVVMKSCKKVQARYSNEVVKTSTNEDAYIDYIMELGSRTLVPKDDAWHTKAEQAVAIEMIVYDKKISKLDKKLLKKLNKI